MLYMHSRHRVLHAIVSTLLLAAGVLLLTTGLAAADPADTLLAAVKSGDRAAVRKLVAQKASSTRPSPTARRRCTGRCVPAIAR
jgi:hypothetical protein